MDCSYLTIQPLLKESLSNSYKEIIINNVSVFDDLKGKCELSLDTETEGTLIGKGVGTVDAVFDSLMNRFSKEYRSLEGVGLKDFSAKIENKPNKRTSVLESNCSVKVSVSNSRGALFTFESTSQSLSGAAVKASVKAVEFFINAEKAFIVVYNALEDAKERNRQDLVSRYTSDISQIVKATSYSDLDFM